MICTLDKKLHNCPCYKDGKCLSETRCCFRESEDPPKLEHKGKWFEKYYN